MKLNDPILLSILGTLVTGAGVCLFAILGWLMKSVAGIKTDVAVMKTYMTDAVKLQTSVAKNRENIIRLAERQDKLKKDVDALHQAKRDFFSKEGMTNG